MNTYSEKLKKLKYISQCNLRSQIFDVGERGGWGRGWRRRGREGQL